MIPSISHAPLQYRGLFSETKQGGRYCRFSPALGDRYGELTIVARLGVSSRGNIRWLLLCDCGREAIRTSSTLNHALRAGQTPQCLHCLRELRGGTSAFKRNVRMDFYRMEWERRRSLYSAASDAKSTEAINEELEQKVAPCRKPALSLALMVSESGVAEMWQPDSLESPNHQRIACLYPISHESSVWTCAICDEPFSRGLGCVTSLDPICTKCVRKELHRCANGHGMTLDDVGKEFNVSRERVRQIEGEALGKLREPRKWYSAREMERKRVQDSWRDQYELERTLRSEKSRNKSKSEIAAYLQALPSAAKIEEKAQEAQERNRSCKRCQDQGKLQYTFLISGPIEIPCPECTR